MPDVISDTNGKLCVGSYHMWRLLSSPDNYSFNLIFPLHFLSGTKSKPSVMPQNLANNSHCRIQRLQFLMENSIIIIL